MVGNKWLREDFLSYRETALAAFDRMTETLSQGRTARDVLETSEERDSRHGLLTTCPHAKR
jgi:hypothetical protein